jgi:glucan phosphoethanolaminetransferase (alkaline phosphatase superfamily)
MPEPGRWPPLRAAALELGLLAVPAGWFLHVYAQHPAGSDAAFWPHLQVLAGAWLLLACLRWVAGLLAPGLRLAQLAVAAVVVSGLLVWLAYMALVLVGMWSWGRVVSKALIQAYATQAPQLAQALGLPFWPVVGALVAAWAVLVGLAARFWVPRDWVRFGARRLPRRWALLLPTAALGLVGLKAWAYAQMPPVDQREPLALTLFAEQAGFKIQNNRVNASATLAAAAEDDRRRYRPAAPGPRPNVILIVADALRADHLGLLGYARPTTPNIDTLARGRLRLLTTVRTACAESACGLLALTRAKPLHQFTDSDITLHEVLQRHGYRVNLVLGGDHTNFYGLRDAFGRVDSYFDGSMSPASLGANDDRALLDQVDRLAPLAGQPMLLHMHLMASHTLGTRLPEAQPFQPAKPYMTWVSKQDALFAAADPRATNHYDNGVAGADLMVRGVLDRLQRRGHLNDALVVITGDHGEMLGEHGEFGHAKGVFEPALKVPFIMLRFGGAAPVAAVSPSLALAAQVDIAPTVLAELGLPVPASWSGHSLLAPASRRFLPFTQGHQTGVYDSDVPGQVLKYWKHQRTGQEFVFDLQADPAEHHNLVAELPPARLQALRSAVMDQVAGLVQ